MRTERQLAGVCVECVDKEGCLSVCGRKKDEVLNITKELLEINNVTDPESLERLIDRLCHMEFRYNYTYINEQFNSYDFECKSPEKFYAQKDKISRRLKEPNKRALDLLEFYYRTLRDYAARKMTSDHDISTLRVSFGSYAKSNCGWDDYDMVYKSNDIRQIFRWVYEQIQDIYYFTNVDPHSWLYGEWVEGKKPPYDWRKVNEYWCGERRRPDGTLIWEKSEGYQTD